MVIGPGWGQDSVGTDGGVTIAQDGATVVGSYGETTLLRGKVGVGLTDFTSPSGKDVPLAISNMADADMEITLRAGDGTVDRRCYLSFESYDGQQQWLTGRNALDAWILYDTTNTCHRLYIDASRTDLRSVGTANPVRVNKGTSGEDDVGTGGLEVWSGGDEDTTPSVLWAKFNGANNQLFGSSSSSTLEFRNNDTVNTSQVFRLTARTYVGGSGAAASLMLMFVNNFNGGHYLNIGGGTGAGSAVTLGQLWAAAAAGTATGTLIADWDINGFGIAADKKLSFAGHSSAPSGSAGEVYYDTTTNKHYGHDGTSWNAMY